MPRPKIAILGRFTESASALRYRGVVTSRALAEWIWAAGGDPITLLPGNDPDALNWAERLAGVDGVLMPGGGDIRPTRYGCSDGHPSLYDMDDVQDESDITLVRYCLDTAIPLLAVCRGLHVLNTALGGRLIVDMPQHHRHQVRTVALTGNAPMMGLRGDTVRGSCYHHQAIDVVAEGLEVVGRAEDETVEAVWCPAPAWTAGVQWHPEDTWDVDPDQLSVARAFVAACDRR